MIRISEFKAKNFVYKIELDINIICEIEDKYGTVNNFINLIESMKKDVIDDLITFSIKKNQTIVEGYIELIRNDFLNNIQEFIDVVLMNIELNCPKLTGYLDI